MNDFHKPCSALSRRVMKPSRAFTLVEMLIVIGIIVLLASLTLMTVAGFTRRSEVQSTQNVMTILDSALKEWELNADRKLSYGKPGEPSDLDEVYDIDQADIEDQAHFDETIVILVDLLDRSQDSRSILANIDAQFLLKLDDPHTAPIEVDESDKVLGIRDAWDKSIRVVFPGRLFDESVNNEPYVYDENDKTIRTAMETMHGVAVNRSIYFTSAGPDGKWGNLHLDVQSDSFTTDQRDDVDDAADNLYSYDVLRMRITP
ncbi:MAG: type II secretion system protein [Planctomycetota bacterium]|nr:type II secretion system protein [Planctomycetota bacterium]